MAKIVMALGSAEERQALKTQLGTAGHQVFLAPTAYRALQLIREQEPEMIITDEKFNELDKERVTLIMRAEEIDPNIQSILFLNDRALYSGRADRTFVKPINGEQLLATVNNCF